MPATSSLSLLPPIRTPSPTPSPTQPSSASSADGSTNQAESGSPASSSGDAAASDSPFGRQLKQARQGNAKGGSATNEPGKSQARTDNPPAAAAAAAKDAAKPPADPATGTSAEPAPPSDAQATGRPATSAEVSAEAEVTAGNPDAAAAAPPAGEQPTGKSIPVQAKGRAKAKGGDSAPASPTPGPQPSAGIFTAVPATAIRPPTAVQPSGGTAVDAEPPTDGQQTTTDVATAATATATNAPSAPVAKLGKGRFGNAKVRVTTPDGSGEPAAAAANLTAASPTTSVDDGSDADLASTADHPSSVATPSTDATPLGAPPVTPPLPAMVATRAAAASHDGGEAVADAVPDEAAFAAGNHPTIASAVHGQLLPNGGTLQVHLNPEHLGSVQVTIRVRDGSVSAAFETTNDDATRLLSHSLGQLKSALEATGMVVDRMHVQQAPKSAGGDAGGQPRGDGKGAGGSVADDPQQRARQDQQRRELMQRMWARVSGGSDPIDLVA